MQSQLQWHPTGAPGLGTTYRLMVDELRGYRSVRVTAAYRDYDASHILERFADWHNGDAPVSAICQPTGVELTTYASGREPNTLALYSTHYRCDTPCVQRRAMTDDRIRELGLAYREPREGIMFMRNLDFDAETHVLGDDHSSTVTFVGEFQLR